VRELYELTQENRKGIEFYAEAMDRLARCENTLDTVEAHAFIAGGGAGCGTSGSGETCFG
jgi:hypothetical protein